MPELKLLLVALFLCSIGWISSYWFRRDDDSVTLENAFLIFLSGVAVWSSALSLLAQIGCFHWNGFAAASLAIFIVGGLRNAFRIQPAAGFRKFAVMFVWLSLILTLFSSLLFRITPPYEAILQGDDASVYSGTAFQLARSGGITYTDDLVRSMTPEERRQLFQNRFREDLTGNFVRFPGGVRLLDPETGTVSFSFYHLLPVWLAFSIKVQGIFGFLAILPFFFSIFLLTIFFCGKRIGGRPAGVGAAILLFLFFPQQYFSRMPLSEPTAQMFFVAGILALLAGRRQDNIPDKWSQRLAGWLWGAAVLCRVDCLYVICVSLVLAMTAIPTIARNRSAWKPLIRTVILFTMVAIYHQLSGGDYIQLFSSPEILIPGAITDFALELVTLSTLLVQHHPWIAGLGFTVLAAGVAALPIPGPTSTRMETALTIAGILFTAAAVIPIVWFRWPPSMLWNHLRWFLPYASPLVWLFLISGIVPFVIRRRRDPVLLLGLILLLITAVPYFIRPLIIPEQPWVMRRFVTMMFPLLFVFSVAGWFPFVERIKNTRHAKWSPALSVLFIGTLFCVGGSFLKRSIVLFQDPIYQKVIRQTAEFAALIPPASLVLIPDSIAGLHLHLPLQYWLGIETLMVPLDPSSSRLTPVLRNYLSRQMQTRPVIACSTGARDLSVPLGAFFSLHRVGEKRYTYSTLPRVDRYSFPATIRSGTYSITLTSLQQIKAPVPVNSQIEWNDPNVLFVNFNEPENGFMWSKETSVVSGFEYSANRGALCVELTTGPVQTPPDPAWWRLLVNGKFAALTKRDGNRSYFRLSLDAPSKIRYFTILSKTFPENPKDPTGSRQLGIGFSSLRFSDCQQP